MKPAMNWVLVAGLAISGCTGVKAGPEDEENFADDGKYDQWNRQNNPAYVDSTFVYEADKLPVEGHTKDVPIAGDYWATARDSINHRWDGEESLSPAEKVEKALGKSGFAKTVTDTWGIYGHGRTACNEVTDCSELKDGSSCVKPRGATGDKAGRCIPHWWGICHGWAPYAFSERPPVKPVERNGVTFYPGDLTALGSLVYSQNLPTKFLSSRCNKKGEELGIDNNGRIREADECIDMNPGTFHIVATNMLGLRKVGYVEDRTYDLQVWNQPVYGFKVTNLVDGKLKEITKQEAISLLGLGLKYDPILGDTEIKPMEKKTGIYEATADGTYIIKMTGDGDADLYAKIGAEPTEDAYDCRPFSGTSREECKVSVKAGDKVYYMIKTYRDKATVQLSLGSVDGTAEYIYNTQAKRFFYVETELEWVSEGSPGRELPDPKGHVRNDDYEYILEADEAGRIQGGEWVGPSRQSHPDFAWWPSGKPWGVLAGGLSYADVKPLIDEAAGPVPVEPTVTTLFEGAAGGSFSTYVTVGVPGGGKLNVTMTGDGNIDLYVKLGRRPTVSSFDKKSATETSNETIELTAPAAGGTYYVRIKPNGAAPVNVKVVATVTPAG